MFLSVTEPLRISAFSRERDSASLRPEKAVADGDENGRHRQRRGQARNQHQPPHPRKQGGLLGSRFGRNSFGHAKLIWGTRLV